MPRYRSFDVGFKRQVAQEFLTGESLNSLSRKYDVARNLIRIWVLKHEGGEFEPEFEHDNRLKAHEVKIAGLERMVGRLTMELEFLRRASDEWEIGLRRNALSKVLPRIIATYPVWAKLIFNKERNDGDPRAPHARQGLRLPTFIAGTALREGALRAFLAGYKAPPLTLYAVYPPTQYLAVKVRVFTTSWSGGSAAFPRGTRKPGSNDRRSLGMSPAPRAMRDVELAALEHVRPVEPGKQLRLQEPHAAAGNARVVELQVRDGGPFCETTLRTLPPWICSWSRPLASNCCTAS